MSQRPALDQDRATKRARKSTNPASTPQPPPDAAEASGASSPIYFWRHSDAATGYLSQWYPCAFTDDSSPPIVYPTAEHFMMYHKAQLFSDAAIAAEILSAAGGPGKVKALGRRVANFDEAKWVAAREGIVRRGNLFKFTRPVKEDLRERLLATGERELVEASPRDRIWGIGYGAAKAGTVGRERWGQNLLGKVLMEVRALLREEEEKKKKGGPGG